MLSTAAKGLMKKEKTRRGCSLRALSKGLTGKEKSPSGGVSLEPCLAHLLTAIIKREENRDSLEQDP